MRRRRCSDDPPPSQGGAGGGSNRRDPSSRFGRVDRRPAAPLDIDITWRLRESRHAIAPLRRVARHVAAAEGFRRGQLSIVVVGSAAMSALHRRYLSRPGPTDVITFDLGSSRRAGYLDAEIVLCADVARRLSRARGGTLIDARAELALYLTHGLLHLSGYDDRTAQDSRRMHAREDALLQRLGFGRVFTAGRECPVS